MATHRLGTLVWEDAGDGEAIVMIHGLGGTSNTFQSVMSELNGYRVIRPDLPGAGRSALRAGRRDMRGLISAVSDCMQAAGVARAHLVGHSLGTLLCQHMAAQNAARGPGQILSLTLFGAISEPPVAARSALRERAQTALEQGMAPIADAVCDASLSAMTRANAPVAQSFVRESIMRQDPRGYAAHCEVLSTATTPDYANIRCPVLLVAGAKDPIAPVDMATALSKRINNATVEVIPDVAHWMTIEAPQRSAQLLLSHVQQSALQQTDARV